MPKLTNKYDLLYIYLTLPVSLLIEKSQSTAVYKRETFQKNNSFFASDS